jgi:hypothetical protein
LGLYLVPRFLDDGSRNHYTMRRLKQKLGTKSVPTGEVEFNGAVGYALRPQRDDAPDAPQADSDAGGLSRMMEMVNGSRFGVALMGLGIARRSFLEAAIYAHHREAKGRLLVDLPLMREQLVDLQVELEAAFAFGFECASASKFHDGARLRRILVPAAKVRLCRIGVEAASQAVEVLGGNGYCEDFGLTRQLRDAQCHPIWEGSENICIIDVLRAIRRDQAHEAVLARIDEALATARQSAPGFTGAAVEATASARRDLELRIAKLDGVDADWSQAVAGRLNAQLTQTVSAALLLELAVDDPRKGLVATRYVRRHLTPDAGWDDRIAVEAGRALLAHDDITEEAAARAAA